MALSYDRPDPSSPAAVASAGFATARRGYDTDQVREFLRTVAAELARLQERERELERALNSARRAPAPAIEELDEATVTQLLGEETARVLSTAREAAQQIRSRAEDGAARLLKEAQEDATRLREQAELETARKRQEAALDAEAEVESAREQGRNMVGEAREYRERVLADLAKRREMARQQLLQMASGRERLVQAFERARIAAVDVQSELSLLGNEPDELVNLSPTTGPVPIVVPRSEVPLTTHKPITPAEPLRRAEPAPVVEEPETVAEEVVDAEPEPEAAPIEVAVVVDAPEADVAEEAVAEEVADAEPDELDVEEDSAPLAPVVSLFAGELPDTATTVEARPSVDDLFAKLRAAKVSDITRPKADDSASAAAPSEPVTVADAVAAEAVAPDEVVELETGESPFVVRDEALAPVELNLARKFKRALADEQNDVLDVLRRREPVRSLADILPALAQHAAPYLEAAREELPGAARAGATTTSTDEPARLERRVADAGVVAAVVESLADEVVEPLRARLAKAIDDADGDNGVVAAAVRSLYRDWKTQRLDDLAADLARHAYARGAYAAILPGTPVRWVSEPGYAGCAETAANVAVGVVRAGDHFPSGHACPPAAARCRCLLVTSPS